MRETYLKARTGIGARAPLWLVLGMSLLLSLAGCWGEIVDNRYEIVQGDGGAPGKRNPPPARKPGPDSAQADQTTPDNGGGSPDNSAGDQSAKPVTYSDVHKGLLKEFCVRCHGEKSARSQLGYFSHLTHDLIAKKKTPLAYWTYVWERIKKGEMPPVKPDAGDEKQRLADGVALYERWAKAGFPAGDAKPAPDNKGKENPYTIFPSSASCKGNAPMPSRLWRLTTLQVQFSLRDIFGNITLPVFNLSRKRTGGLTNSASESGLDNVDVTTLVKTFEAVAKEVMTKTARWKSCLAKKDTVCVKQLIALDGRKLWRRSPTSAEIAKLLKGFDTLKVDSRESALSYVLERMLLSANFLFRSELGKPEPGKAGILRLTPHEVAAFLSYNLWQSAPDDALLKAADEGKLGTPDLVRTQLQRMLQDPRAKRGLSSFFSDWLHIRDLLNQEKDASVFKGLTPQLRQDVVSSAIRFLEYVTWEKKGSVADVFQSDAAFINESVAKLYSGLNASGSQFKQAKADPTKRAGVLTTPAFLMAQAGKDTTGFVHRGVFFLEELLCRPVGDPPMGAVAAGLARVASADTSKLTQREIMEKIHSADASCNTCHKKIDPIGAAFEIFNPLGQFRLTEKGKTIDPSGKLEGFGDMKPQFQNAVELIRNLANSQHFQQCVTLKLYTHLWGRAPEGSRNCAVASLYEHLKGKQFQMLQIHHALLDNQHFFLRTDAKKAGTP